MKSVSQETCHNNYRWLLLRRKYKEWSNMKKLKNKVALLVAMMLLVMGLAGCGEKAGNSNGADSGATTQSANSGEASDVADTVYPFDFTDSYGNVVTIEAEPERIVSVAPNMTELLFELGVGDRVVGRTDYCDYPAETANIDSVGAIDKPDLEKIISLEPDVVIATTFTEEGIAKLDAAGIPVVVLHEEGTVDGVYVMISDMGNIVNKNQQAASTIEEMQTTIADVQEKTKDLEKPTVYYVVGYGEYGDYTAGGDTFVGGMLEIAGGDNIAKDISGWNISLEKLIESDPDIIIISEWMKDDFVNAPNYCELSAVKNGKVYTMDVNMLERQGSRNDDGILELAKIFHPEVFE